MRQKFQVELCIIRCRIWLSIRQHNYISEKVCVALSKATRIAKFFKIVGTRSSTNYYFCRRLYPIHGGHCQLISINTVAVNSVNTRLDLITFIHAQVMPAFTDGNSYRYVCNNDIKLNTNDKNSIILTSLSKAIFIKKFTFFF